MRRVSHCCFDERRIVLQFLHLIAVLQQCQHSISNQIDGGFMPGHQ